MAKFKLKFVLSEFFFREDKFKLKFVACPSIAPRTIPPSAQLMDDLDGEVSWSRAIQETFNRLDKAVGSLLDGSRPACFPIENQHLPLRQVLVLDGEASWLRAIQQTSNRRTTCSRWGSKLVESHPTDFQPPCQDG